MADYTQAFEDILAEYRVNVEEVRKKTRVFDGFMGLGNHPGNAACHEIMDKAVEKLCAEAAEEPDPEAAGALVEKLFHAEGAWEGPEYARLALLAAQRHALALIPLLAAEKRETLGAWYQKTYPRRERTPAQDRILAALMGM